MQRLGLSLSGGGFRATLFHLGVVRLLRDAGVLPKITHVTAVSGGSILGAHLVLNWQKYNGSAEEFEEVAADIIRFVRLDVRNRIVRRFPGAAAVNAARQLLRQSKSRRLTRAGLLECYYEKYLYGDTALSRLPEWPQLHILATNLSEGCLGSFNRNGLLLQRRVPGRRDHFDRVRLGLATVPMAVAASSAFPAFFPPLEITGWDVGADQGEFKRHAFTDGGVYDNLGLRMFRCLEQSWVRDNFPLRREDFLAFEECIQALKSASGLPEESPLRRIRQLIETHASKFLKVGREAQTDDDWSSVMIGGLWEIIRSEKLYRDSCFVQMELTDAAAQSLFKFVTESGREPELNDHLWLNRQIVETVLRQMIGKPCLRMSPKEFDGILVSDAGGKFKISGESRTGGLVRTALRASDILMNRVWQLESEAFENVSGIECISIFDVVEPSEDPTAPNPEVQRQAAKCRTDLDSFSDLEISALVQHGYCVARKKLRSDIGFPKDQIPNGAPWDPLAAAAAGSHLAPPLRSRLSDEDVALDVARKLRHSSKRRIGSRLFSFHDWPSYIWLVLILGLVIGLPYTLFDIVRTTSRQQMVIEAITDIRPQYKKILELMKSGPATKVAAMPFKTVSSINAQNLSGCDVLVDSRIFDLRGWGHGSATPLSAYTHLRVQRKPAGNDNTHLRIQFDSNDESMPISCSPPSLSPTLSRMQSGDGKFTWSLDFDFSRVPVSNQTLLNIERILPDDAAFESPQGGRFIFDVWTKTDVLEVWLLMPEGRDYESFQVLDYTATDSGLPEIIVPHTIAEMPYGSVVTFRMFNTESSRFECQWTWSDAVE